MERYDLQRIPVTGNEGRLLGSISVDDIIDVFEDEATEDMYRMVGVHEEEKAAGPFWRSVRGRLPWLCVNLATALGAGLVVKMFESTLAQAVTLAAFLPVIAGQGGIAGTQTLTLIVRSIALGELNDKPWKLLAKELGLGIVHGAARIADRPRFGVGRGSNYHDRHPRFPGLPGPGSVDDRVDYSVSATVL